MKANSVLVHCCCAHCAAYTIDYWRQQRYEVSALWHNPNIHPYMEHQHRLEAMKFLAQRMKVPLIVPEGYGIIDYFRQVVGHEAERCQYCFRLRLSKTAKTAHQMIFNTFTTTLLISPHQQHDLRSHTKAAGNGYALLLAARKLSWIFSGLVSDVHLFEKVHGRLFGLCLGNLSHPDRPQREVFNDRQVREEVEVLKNHAHFFSDLFDILQVIGQFDAIHNNPPTLMFLQAVDAADQG